MNEHRSKRMLARVWASGFVCWIVLVLLWSTRAGAHAWRNGGTAGEAGSPVLLVSAMVGIPLIMLVFAMSRVPVSSLGNLIWGAWIWILAFLIALGQVHPPAFGRASWVLGFSILLTSARLLVVPALVIGVCRAHVRKAAVSHWSFSQLGAVLGGLGLVFISVTASLISHEDPLYRVFGGWFWTGIEYVAWPGIALCAVGLVVYWAGSRKDIPGASVS